MGVGLFLRLEEDAKNLTLEARGFSQGIGEGVSWLRSPQRLPRQETLPQVKRI